MRFSISLLMLLGGYALGQSSADTVDWYIDSDYSGQTTRLFRVSGQDITGQAAHLFQLIADPGNNTDFAALLTAGSGLTGWAIGAEHPISADYGADDDIVIGNYGWKIDNPHLDFSSAMTNSAGAILSETPFYFRWFNTTSNTTATEAGIIYRNNGDWITGPEAVFPTFPQNIDAPLDYGIAANLGSAKTNGIAGWRSMPRALLTTKGTPMRWFVDHGIELAPGDTWDDADGYDSDTNGILNRAEYIAGTDPTDPESYLRIIDLNISPGPTNWTTELTWLGAKGGATNTLWHLYVATNGITASSWSAVTGGTWSITGTGTNTWSQESPPPATPYFLRIHAVAP